MGKSSNETKRAPETARTVPGEVLPGKFLTSNGKLLLQALVIAMAVVWIYWPALHGDWLWDDDNDITGNAIVHSPTGLRTIWFEPGRLLAFYPISFSVEWIEWHLWGMNTFGYHFVNVVLHLVSALLVWRLFSKLGLRLAWLGGLIFAIHPVQVESVAWIAEVKNAMCLPPFLLAMGFYLDYEKNRRARDYWLALLLFFIAMLCKTSMVMFPVVMLLHAWWKRDRIDGKDLKVSAPFFVVSLAVTLMALSILEPFVTEQAAIPLGGLFSRLACAGLSISFYFSKCFLPVELMPVYPLWKVDPPSPAQFLPWPFLIGTLFWLWSKREAWGRHVLLGVGFFLLFLAPFVGLVKAPYMFFTWVMDHELYVAIIGLIGLAVAAMGRIDDLLSPPLRPYGMAAVAAALALLAWGSHAYAALYHDSATLWSYTLRVNPGAFPAYNNLGTALQHQGKMAEAMELFEEAVQINPDYAEAHNNLGVQLARVGQIQQAIAQYEAALRIKPGMAEFHYNLGSSLQLAGRMQEAVDQFEEALRINPGFAEPHDSLGNILQRAGRLPEAMAQFERALQINPDYADAHYNLGNALQQAGRFSEAIDHYEQALRIDPNYALARNNLGVAFQLTNRMPEAIEQYEQSLRLNPNDAEAHNNLGYAFAQTSRLPEAIDQYVLALKLRPDLANAHLNLGLALLQTGRLAEAAGQFEAALRINPHYTEARTNLDRLKALRKRPRSNIEIRSPGEIQ